jgi:hypothetical protein
MMQAVMELSFAELWSLYERLMIHGDHNPGGNRRQCFAFGVGNGVKRGLAGGRGYVSKNCRF